MTEQLRNTIDLIHKCLSMRATTEQNWTHVQVYRFWRWFYTAKCILCILLNRIGQFDFYSDTVEIATYNYVNGYDYEFGETAGWNAVGVGIGVLTGWFFAEYSDGYP